MTFHHTSDYFQQKDDIELINNMNSNETESKIKKSKGCSSMRLEIRALKKQLNRNQPLHLSIPMKSQTQNATLKKMFVMMTSVLTMIWMLLMKMSQTQKPTTNRIVMMKSILTMIWMLLMKIIPATCHKLLWTALHVRAAPMKEL